MRNHKWVSGLLAIALVAGMASSALAAPTVADEVYSDKQAVGVNKPVQQVQQELQQAGIKDVKATDWFAGSVTVLVQAALLPPAPDGSFNPTAALNAGDGVAVFAKVLGIAAKTDTPEQALSKAQEAGLVGGDVSVDRDMTRMETARLLAKALGVQPKTILTPAQYPFNDPGNLSAEDLGILAALYELGIFKGYEDRTFRPDNILTRAEIAILVDRILGAQ